MTDYQTCGVPLHDHIEALLELVHPGTSCIDSYRALIEVAEAMRVFHAYPVHVPTQTGEILGFDPTQASC